MNPNRLARLRVDLADAQDEGTPVKLRPVDLVELLTTFDEARMIRAEKAQLERLRESDRQHINGLERREIKLRARIDELEKPTEPRVARMFETPTGGVTEAIEKLGLE